jgi:ABC-2 type transport system permease protein
VVTWWVITWTELVRLFRDRGNIFFVLVFPLLLVVLIGASFGGQSAGTRVGVVADPQDAVGEQLRADLAALDAVDVEPVTDVAELRDEVARGALAAGVVVPAGSADALAAGEPVAIAFVARQDGRAASLQTLVEGVVADRAAIVDAARVATARSEEPIERTTRLAEALAGVLPGVTVTTTEIAVEGGLAQEFAGLGQFDLGASSQLFLFTFLTALSGGAALIRTRQLGIARRMLATPTRPGVLLVGLGSGRIAVAVLQASYIVVVTALVFGVDWGDPLATTLVVLLFCLVSGGAGALLGATLRNESQASGVGVGVGLGAAALGGSMVPLELFPGTLRLVARITPHAWANEAMAELVRRDGTVGDVIPELLVLTGFAVLLLAGATVALRRNLTR